MDSDASKPAVIDIAAKADALLLQIYTLVQGKPGVSTTRSSLHQTKSPMNNTQAKEMEYLLNDYLTDHKKFLTLSKSRHLLTITPAGFEHIHEILTTQTKSNMAFCAMWFDPTMEPIWLEAIKPAIEETRHEPVRIDEKEFNDDINAQMIMLIRKSKFLIADFTGDRGGVYFEAGFAKGLGLEVIYTCEKEAFKTTAPHFDINHYNFILWNRENLLSFKKQLADRITITIAGE